MTEIRDKRFGNERDLYAAKDMKLVNCSFSGKEDGESALKEARDIILEDCRMELRYPLWHVTNVRMSKVTMTETCRAPLWYTRGIEIADSDMCGVKALRECEDVHIKGSKITSPEYGWHSKNISAEDSEISGEYAFFGASGITLKNVRFSGKYSFQYVKDLVIEDSFLDTKDAFWHAENVTVKNSVVKGEYLAWYSENVTFENCKLIGTQPLCYCKGLVLKNCETEGCDLAFEYSEVDADIRGEVLSVKNPRSGRIAADSFGEIILTEDSVYPCEAEIINLTDK